MAYLFPVYSMIFLYMLRLQLNRRGTTRYASLTQLGTTGRSLVVSALGLEITGALSEKKYTRPFYDI